MSSTRTWLLDLGNTRLKFAPLLADGSVGDVHSVTHAGQPDVQAVFAQALAHHLPAGCVAMVCSVAAENVRTALLLALTAHAGRIELASTQRQFAGLSIAYANPRNLGVDRWLALLAVHAQRREPVLLVSVGTALTIDLLDGQGQHHGGLIAPAPDFMREALHRRAPHLPQHGGQALAFASDTTDALASGCIGAALGLIERSQHNARALLGHPASLLIHGGGAGSLATHLPNAQLAQGLVLTGLAQWAQASS